MSPPHDGGIAETSTVGEHGHMTPTLAGNATDKITADG